MTPTSTIGSRPRAAIGAAPGFTLLELLVVLVIMTVLSGVAMATIWPALADARLRAGTRMVISALRYARNDAVTRRTDTAVLFDFERQGLSVSRFERTDAGEETWDAVTTPAGRFRRLPEGVVIAEITRDAPEMAEAPVTEGAEMAVVFSAIGQADDTRITLREPRGQQRIVLVDGITGRCELVSDEP